MWGYNINIYGVVISGIILFLNIVLVKKLMEISAGRRCWMAVTLCSIVGACYLTPYFAGGRTFYVQEMTAGMLLFLFCYALLMKTGTADKETEKADKKKTGLLLIIPATGLCMMGCLFLGDLEPYYFSAVCCGCVLVADLSGFYLYYILGQNETHIRQRDVYRQQTAYYKNQMEVITESGERLRALRHDMKNHMLHLSAELRQGHYEETLRYLEDMERELQNPTERVRTGNKEIDSLLNYKLQKAAQVLSEVECDITVPMELVPKSFDINVILGNLLDNAIEAAQNSGERRLKLVMRSDRGVLLIHMENSVKEPPERKGNRFISTKENVGEHGIGLQNVRRMVDKKNGSIEFTCEENMFLVEVMLYMNEV